MNNRLVTRIFFILPLACEIFVVSSETQASSSSKGARLIIQRAPNFGNDLVIRLSIDGKRVADIPRNQHYGGFLSAGRHVLNVVALPNTESRQATAMRLTIRSASDLPFQSYGLSIRIGAYETLGIYLHVAR